MSSEQIDAPLLPPEPMAEPKSVRLGFVTGLVAVDKLQVLSLSTPKRKQCASAGDEGFPSLSVVSALSIYDTQHAFLACNIRPQQLPLLSRHVTAYGR